MAVYSLNDTGDLVDDPDDDTRTLDLSKILDSETIKNWPLLPPTTDQSPSADVPIRVDDDHNDLAIENDDVDDGLRRVQRVPKVAMTDRTSHRGSRIDCSASISSSNSNGIAAVYEMRGIFDRGCIGIAFIDVRCPTLLLSQIMDSTYAYARTINKLICLDPNEVVLACSQSELSSSNAPTGLSAVLHEYVPTLRPWSRRKFDIDIGRNAVNFLCAQDYRSVISELSDSCLCACGGLLDYLQETKQICLTDKDKNRPWLKIVYQSADSTMFMNTSAFIDLNLTGSDGIYSFFKFTLTLAGSRLLKCSLSQPLADLTVIEQRLDAVKELMDDHNRHILCQIKSCLQSFPDLEKTLFSLATMGRSIGRPNKTSAQFEKIAEHVIGDMIIVKHSLDLIKPFCNALSLCKTHLLSSCAKMINDDERFETLSKTVSSVIHCDAKFQSGVLKSRTQKCYAIKPGINQLLDVARRAYSEVVDDIIEYINELNRSNAESMEIVISFSQARGFHAKLRWLAHVHQQSREFPTKFICLETSSVLTSNSTKWISFTTTVLMRLNERSNEAIMDVFRLSHHVLYESIENMIANDQLTCLHRLLECVALVDLVQSLAYYAKLRRYSRPNFRPSEAKGFVLKLKNARHPALDRFASKRAVIANQIVIDSNKSPLMLITGPNMSGKTTIMKMIGVITVMAQIGSYVPADDVVMTVTNQLFTRMSHDQLVPRLHMSVGCSSSSSFVRSTSSHVNEMREMAFTLHCLSSSLANRPMGAMNNYSKNLVLIDELCRGVESQQAFALTFAIYEHFLMLENTMTVGTAHLPEMVTAITRFYPQISVFQMDESFRVMRGQCSSDDYGVRLAEKTGLFPESVIIQAKESVVHDKQKSKLNVRMSNEVARISALVNFWREWNDFKEYSANVNDDTKSEKCNQMFAKMKAFVHGYARFINHSETKKS